MIFPNKKKESRDRIFFNFSDLDWLAELLIQVGTRNISNSSSWLEQIRAWVYDTTLTMTRRTVLNGELCNSKNSFQISGTEDTPAFMTELH